MLDEKVRNPDTPRSLLDILLLLMLTLIVLLKGEHHVWVDAIRGLPARIGGVAVVKVGQVA